MELKKSWWKQGGSKFFRILFHKTIFISVEFSINVFHSQKDKRLFCAPFVLRTGLQPAHSHHAIMRMVLTSKLQLEFSEREWHLKQVCLFLTNINTFSWSFVIQISFTQEHALREVCCDQPQFTKNFFWWFLISAFCETFFLQACT